MSTNTKRISMREEILPPKYFSHGNDYERRLIERAHIAVAAEDWEAAEELYLEAVESLRSTLGPDHIEVAMVMHNLAAVLENQGLKVEARYINRHVTLILVKGKSGGQGC